MNIRNHIATDGLDKSLGGNLGMDVKIKYADGSTQTGLRAMVLYDKIVIDPESGEEIVIKETSVTLSKYRLNQPINAGDKIYIEYPKSPDDQTVKLYEIMDGDKAPIENGSIGYITIYPKTTDQA